MDSKNIFISFSSKQQAKAIEICNFIEANGLSCFISSRDLIAGEEYAKQLIDNISASDAVVLILTSDSNKSPHVLREIEYAVSHNIPIVVYVEEECTLSKSMEYFLMTHQWLLPSSDQNDKLLESIDRVINTKTIEPHVANINKKNDNKNDNKKVANTPSGLMLIMGLVVVLLVVIIILLLGPAHSGSKTPDSDKDYLASTQDDSKNNDKDSDNKDSDDKDSKDNDSDKDRTDNNIPSSKDDYAIGDTVVFGSYNDEPIEWRVLSVDDEDEKMLIVSKYILSMKVYDAAESGIYNEYDGVDYWSHENYNVDDEEILVNIRGNNDWSKSNIRTWLNSDAELVTYDDQAPDRRAVGANYYNNESGFLYNFTKEEREAIFPTQVISRSNAFSDKAHNGQVRTTDYVFLLSYEELGLLENAGISIYTKPTEGCINNDKNKEGYASFTSTANMEEYYWWLRDNDGESISKAFIVVTPYESGYNVLTQNVGASDYGIRPAMWVDTKSDCISLAN